jgi:hypothetical protein
MATASALHIGNIVNKETRKELTKFIEAVFTIGTETGQSGATIRHALSMFKETQEVKNVTVSGCNFTQK